MGWAVTLPSGMKARPELLRSGTRQKGAGRIGVGAGVVEISNRKKRKKEHATSAPQGGAIYRPVAIPKTR